MSVEVLGLVCHKCGYVSVQGCRQTHECEVNEHVGDSDYEMWGVRLSVHVDMIVFVCVWK